MSHVDHEDATLAAIHADLDRQQAEDQVARTLQDRADNRLTAEERRIACGCLSTFILQMGHDLRKGGITPEGEARYRADIMTAGRAIDKLMAAA